MERATRRNERAQADVVVSGHVKAGGHLDANATNCTRDYPSAFEENAASTKTSAERIEALEGALPDAPGARSLDIGAAVSTGEMTWSVLDREMLALDVAGGWFDFAYINFCTEPIFYVG